MSGLPSSRSILDHFSALRDHREQWRVLYPLREVLLLVLCATLSGMEDFVEIRLWGQHRLDFLRRFLLFAHGTPAHDTLNDVVNGLDPELFKTCFATWVEALRDEAPDIIAIDGKTSRRSHARSKGRAPLHMVSAWASRQRLVLGQEAVEVKSNEITAIPLLLERLAGADRMIGGDDAWLIIDDTSLPKKGMHSVGVAPQYASELGKNANCQTLVSLTLASREVPIMVGLRLFLPDGWIRELARLDRAGVPQDRRDYQNKPEIALAEIDCIRGAGVRFGCVLADAGYRLSASFRQGLSARGLIWAVGIPCKQKVYPVVGREASPSAGVIDSQSVKTT